MTKNGLFLVSIGLLIFLFSTKNVGGMTQYDVLSMTTAIVMIIAGGILTHKGNKKAKKDKLYNETMEKNKKKDE